MDADRAAEPGVTARARIVSYATVGVDPKIIGIESVPAIALLLELGG